jgi:hypothetical protein
VVAHLLALAVGITWATNTVGADLKVAGLLVAGLFATYGWTCRADLRLVVFTAFAPAVVWLLGSVVV